MPSAFLMGVSSQLHSTASLLTGKLPPRYPVDKRPGGPQNRCGRYGKVKNLALARKQTLAVQPVARRYTN
jgi:hypothetical protein